ncbi:hypothetical protein T439DRAFT_321534 [Meredithblackwellia eburnea MCA 4105]
MTTPVSLPLQSAVPASGSTIVPPSLLASLPITTSQAVQQPQQGHSHSNSFSGANAPQPPQPSGPYSSNTTRVLLLSKFSSELKTRDIQQLFGEWEDDRGGFKIKWSDDESCWIVFQDPVVAKRAFLTLLGNPPPALQPTATHTPKLAPYTGPDVANILQAVQNRPRSRSVNGGHSRKGSALGSGGGSLLSNGTNGNGPSGLGHNRSGSYGRGRGNGGSFGQKQLQEVIRGEGSGTPPPVPAIPDHLANEATGSGESGKTNGHGRGDSISQQTIAE